MNYRSKHTRSKDEEILATTRFSRVIKAARLRLDLSAREVVNRMGVDICPSYFYYIEKNNRIPSPKIIIKLCLVLGLDLKQMLEIAKVQKVEEYRRKIDKKYRVK